jgi:hypothetical protein
MRNILFASLLLLPLTSHAYIGPGMGAGALAVVFGVLGAIFLGLFAILWYPIKRLFGKSSKKKAAGSKDEYGPS